jgi:hypothetical protein
MTAPAIQDILPCPGDPGADKDQDRIARILGVVHGSADRFIRSLPFCHGDATAGAENEFQAVVQGRRQDVDLARTLEASNYYQNLVLQAKSGESSQKRIQALESFLRDKDGRTWENSWVRFPRQALNASANAVFNRDLKADKSNPASPYRADAGDFVREENGEPLVRIPVSYLLKLTLAQVLGDETGLPLHIRAGGEKMMAHFSNDNSSPELFSFYPVTSGAAAGVGDRLAGETLIRFLLTQALVAYAQDRFGLSETGQQVKVFFSPTPPTGQKRLNDCISDAFYRELFMSPCLSGWDLGEKKKDYMNLCHQVMSRSQINAVSRLREAGIITSNLVVLPNISNISLANNGTHVSLGSVKLSAMLADPASGFGAGDEKYLGDLSIKIGEHFLPLMATTYSGAPHRLEFEDFHPERVLGFLPHELDDTHLRMIWRRWKKKADLNVMGQPLTPFGPVWLDRLIAGVFGLKGDFIPDARLIDYFTSVMSTFNSPALDGSLASEASLEKDLTEMGVFDHRMSLYQLIRLRKFKAMGYSGFEHRYFSVFENIRQDMGGAADLQLLITALTQKYIHSNTVDHAMIPDTPATESERRQIFFCTAIGIPTFFVKTRTPNQFLKRILKQARKTRASRRYPGFTRVLVKEYQQALIRLIRADGSDLIEAFKLGAAVDDLEKRIASPMAYSAWGRLTKGILGDEATFPMAMTGRRFNARAEQFYGNSLRQSHIRQGFAQLEKAMEEMDLWGRYRDRGYGNAVRAILGEQDPFSFLKSVGQAFMDDDVAKGPLKKLIYLIILVVSREMQLWDSTRTQV